MNFPTYQYRKVILRKAILRTLFYWIAQRNQYFFTHFGLQNLELTQGFSRWDVTYPEGDGIQNYYFPICFWIKIGERIKALGCQKVCCTTHWLHLNEMDLLLIWQKSCGERFERLQWSRPVTTSYQKYRVSMHHRPNKKVLRETVKGLPTAA